MIFFVYLLCSDTAVCRICAEFLKKFLQERFNLINTDVICVKGLVVNNTSTFLQKGLKSLFKILVEGILEKINTQQYEILLNITGGFKATIPYLSIFAMLYNISLYYIFEDEDELIEIKPIPITYDYSFISQNYELFVEIESNTAIQENEISQSIINNTFFNVFFIRENNQITTSFLGDIFWDRYKKNNQPTLVKSKYQPQQKRVDLGNVEHHGKEKLKEIAEILVKSPYVESILNSTDNQPHRRYEKVIPLRKDQTQQYIQREEEGICIVIDYESDAGYAMLVKTTGRIFYETKYIAEILKKFILNKF